MAEEYQPKTMETTGPNPSPLYIKNPVIIQVPYLQRISPNPYLSIKPSNLMTQCDFFIYLYLGDPSHDRYQSFSRCIFFIHFLSSRCTIPYLIVHSFLSYRSFIPSSRFTHCHMLA